MDQRLGTRVRWRSLQEVFTELEDAETEHHCRRLFAEADQPVPVPRRHRSGHRNRQQPGSELDSVRADAT